MSGRNLQTRIKIICSCLLRRNRLKGFFIMKIWITRHGQTRLNKARLMQGLTDEPLNERGLEQAREARALIGDVKFDAVYTSPLKRAVVTGAVIGGVDPSEVITDKRIIEADFGPYEGKKYYLLGPAMTLYWMFPERLNNTGQEATAGSCVPSPDTCWKDRTAFSGALSLTTARSGSLNTKTAPAA